MFSPQKVRRGRSLSVSSYLILGDILGGCVLFGSNSCLKPSFNKKTEKWSKVRATRD